MQCAGGIALAGSPPDRLSQCIQVETLAFWNAYLKQDPDARRHLASHKVQGCSADSGRFAAK
jgi:hypothetical protein